MLETTQEALLVELVEADKRSPGSSFFAHNDNTTGAEVADILHPGLPRGGPKISWIDIKILGHEGYVMIEPIAGRPRDRRFYVLPTGRAYCTSLMERRGGVSERIQQRVHEYIESQ